MEAKDAAPSLMIGHHGNIDLYGIVRPNIVALKPYRCARDDYDSGVLLDANENSFGAPVEVPAVTEVERYPCPYQWELKELVSAFRGVRREQVFLGVGSDEAIDLLIRVFCRPGKDSILITPPTYGMYKVSAAVNDVEVKTCNLTEDFNLDLAPTLAALAPSGVDDTTGEEGPGPRIVWLCSPGNPTAKLLRVEDVRAVRFAHQPRRRSVCVCVCVCVRARGACGFPKWDRAVETE